MRPDTRLTHAGRHPEDQHGAVNPPVYRASTITFASVAEKQDRYAARLEPGTVYYGRYGTPTTAALEEAIAELEGAYGAILTASGQSATACALLACLQAGDHLLLTDSAYGPTRGFATGPLRRFGVETTLYPPTIGAGIADLLRPETRVLFCESPGSLTFEVQDIPAMVQAVHAASAAAGRTPPVIMIDNTWASPLFLQPLAMGVDVSIHAATKYIGGHSDAMLGAIACTEPLYPQLKQTMAQFGQNPGSEEAWLGLRGLRTLGVRLRQHQSTGIQLATWLSRHPAVARVMHPALHGDPGHALWHRDFKGASGLFGVELEPVAEADVHAMLDGLKLFAMGYSWGGFESLMLPTSAQLTRSTGDVPAGPLLRIHAGLEDPDDLIADLDAGLATLPTAAA